MNILILGCGPAGLLAAEAAEQTGHSVTIMSRKVRSVMPGAQYLHEAIKGVTSQDQAKQINYLKIGDRAGYAQKVYGSPEAPCSWDLFPEGAVDAYPIAEVYDDLWFRWESEIMDFCVGKQHITDLLANPAYDLVVSSIPKPVTCVRPLSHKFEGQQIYVSQRAVNGCPDDTIIYNGSGAGHWYRTSRLWGHGATEATARFEGAKGGIKPTKSNCNCHPELMRVGRFGKWEKGVLVHDAYNDVKEAMVMA